MLSPFSHVTPLKTVAAAVGAGVLMAGGIAAAATGLPGAAHDTASQVTDRADVGGSGPDAHSAGHADQRGQSAQHAKDPSTRTEDGERTRKGAAVSSLATTLDSSLGVDKGAAISSLASGGQSHAGENNSAEAPRSTAGGESDWHARVDTPNSGGADRPESASGAGGGAEQSDAPVETPPSGGAGTADDASSAHGGGASTQGTDTADSASGGQSAAGSQNRP